MAKESNKKEVRTYGEKENRNQRNNVQRWGRHKEKEIKIEEGSKEGRKRSQ